MKSALSLFFLIIGVISTVVIFAINVLSSYYLIQGGNVVWVVLAWIFGLFPSFLLPLFTPYFAYALLAWVVALLAYGLSGTLRQKRF
jgi:hypothetical protein